MCENLTIAIGSFSVELKNVAPSIFTLLQFIHSFFLSFNLFLIERYFAIFMEKNTDVENSMKTLKAIGHSINFNPITRYTGIVMASIRIGCKTST